MITIPSIGLGTFRLKGEAVIQSIRNGLDVGYRHIDTAQIYDNEGDVGVVIAASAVQRDAVFLTTKIWTSNLGRDALLPSLRDSLAKLRTDHVDLTLIHWPSPDDALPVAEYMNTLARARDAGLTRLIGVSNFTIAHLQQAVDAVGAEAIATLQIEVHPFLQNRALRAFAAKHGIHVTAYMPLAYGKVMQDPTIAGIAEAHGATAAQIALAWSLQHGMTVIPSSTQRANLISNLQAASIHLSGDEMAAIDALDHNDRLANPDFAPRWD